MQLLAIGNFAFGRELSELAEKMTIDINFTNRSKIMTLNKKWVFPWLLLLMSGCTTISPTLQQSSDAKQEVFSHERLDHVLQQSVDNRGRVDYQALKQQPDDLEAYYLLISRYSPDSNPDLFPAEQHRLAYWINAYNAAAIKIVLNNYPIAGVEEVTPPFPLFFLPDKTGFFIFQRPVFGTVSTSLYYLENSVIRERFFEPRVHFALNCASRGCPELPNYAFTGEQLDSQLEQEARRFFAEPRNFRIELETKTVYMSSIMDWYEEDFINWYQYWYPGRNASLINYAILYLPEQQSRELQENASEYQVEFIPYDWRLNDQYARK